MAISICNLLPGTNYTCFIVPALFSKPECASLLTPEIKASFQKAIANYPVYYRNNDRYVTDDEVLASELFSKVKQYLPETIEVDSAIAAETGVWQIQSLNTRLRYCKYAAGQYFHRHLDGIYYKNEQEQSKLTFMIYLNGGEDFTGGQTLFFKDKNDTIPWAAYTPQQGDLIVFDHNVWHEGAILHKGEKYVLRSDIIYKRISAASNNAAFSSHLGYIWSLVRLNEHTLLSGGRDKKINVWSLSGELLRTLTGHENSILSIARMSDDIFISGSRDKQIIVWEHFIPVKTIHIHSAVVLSLCALSDTLFASGSGDNTIKIADIHGTVLHTLYGHNNWVWGLVQLSDTVIASCSEDATIKIWNMSMGVPLCTFHENSPVISITYNKETHQLISGCLDGTITIRTLDDTFIPATQLSFSAHKDIVRTIKCLSRGRFASGSEDNMIKVWSNTGELIAEYAHDNFVQAIESIDMNTIMSASYDGTIKVWQLT